MLVHCSGNTSLALNCSRIQCQDYIKRNTETKTMAARGRETCTCATENEDWANSALENKLHMSRNIYDCI